MDNWEEKAEKKNNVERKTIIERPKQINIPLVNGCLVPIAVLALTILCVRECKRSGVRLEQEQIKLEQMKKQVKEGTFGNDTMPIITPDTLKIGSFQKTYIPLFRMYQGRQKD